MQTAENAIAAITIRTTSTFVKGSNMILLLPSEGKKRLPPNPDNSCETKNSAATPTKSSKNPARHIFQC